ncbi:unknown [Parabacteroides merdae CAG:48]|nr:unknown [Parabacteroides merdae CAG:48]
MPISQKFRFVEIDRHPFPITFRDLETVAQSFINPFDIFDCRESIGRTPFYIRYVLRSQQSDSVGPFPVTTSTSRLLVISLHRVRKLRVDHHTHVPFINPHSERVSGNQHTRKSFYPIGLPLCLQNRVQASMEIFSRNARRP